MIVNVVYSIFDSNKEERFGFEEETSRRCEYESMRCFIFIMHYFLGCHDGTIG